MICVSALFASEFLADATRPSIRILIQRLFPLEQSKNFTVSVGELKLPLESLNTIGLSCLHGKKTDFLLQEVFARLILYNYASLIARKIPVPQEKQINFSVAILVCKQFLKGKIRPAQIFEILSKHLSPIRPGRQYRRYQNPVSAVAFQYWCFGAYTSEYERNTVHVDCGLFAMNLLYALHYYGLATCPIIWGSEPDNDKKIRKILDIPECETVALLITVGSYPADSYRFAKAQIKETNTVFDVIN